ncbi:hypothetical protein D1816_23025 [Aquimarina sp. AD10]|uniref:hypothetical protein n=1 Tax=Aquimarina sp. AD10 TaxID=1714849 RepID=UPI000E53A5FB|nr:hypothetical protein [Aquimarina sp. AD10]AXT63097.1 hypothetical protein D1816_23025 [Aquimarina sp. AD10]RKM98687.1 hypothetical protein D7033_12180 [Aquimarina sp. AD10]
MNKNLKTALFVLNAIVLILAIVWVKNDSPEIEPIIVIVGQIIALLLLYFEKKLPFTTVKTVSKSQVDIDVSSEDESIIHVEDIQDDSRVKIKRGNDRKG